MPTEMSVSLSLNKTQNKRAKDRWKRRDMTLLSIEAIEIDFQFTSMCKQATLYDSRVKKIHDILIIIFCLIN